MAHPDGTPIWFELMTSDADGAEKFYADVVGWSIAPSGIETAGDYRILTAPDGQGVGGLMTLPDGAPMKPGWFCYIGVQNVDGTAETIEALGGRVLMGPQDMAGVGRLAMVADPQGMIFYIMRGDSPQDSRAFHVTAPGHCGWHELVNSDHTAALIPPSTCPNLPCPSPRIDVPESIPGASLTIPPLAQRRPMPQNCKRW